MRWNQEDKVLEWSQEREEEDRKNGVDPERLAMEEFSRMASSVTKCLQFTSDTPANHETGDMPVLDTSMWVGLEERAVGIPEPYLEEGIHLKTGKMHKIVLHKFYQKPMTNLLTNLESNPVPEKQKVTTTTQEIIRRLKNTSRDLPVSVIEDVLLRYMEELKVSGHSQGWRETVLEAGMKGYMRMWQKERKGEGRLNRPDKSTRRSRRYNKLCGKFNWFNQNKGKEKEVDGNSTAKGGGARRAPETEGVLYVPFTPGSALKKTAGRPNGWQEEDRKNQSNCEDGPNSGRNPLQPNTLEW